MGPQGEQVEAVKDGRWTDRFAYWRTVGSMLIYQQGKNQGYK